MITSPQPPAHQAPHPASGVDEGRSVGFPAWWMVGVLLAFYILSTVDRGIMAMMVEPIKADLGLSDFRMGLILGPAFGILFTLFGLFSGWVADRGSRRWLIFGGIMLWSLTTMASGLARSFGVLFIMRMLVAVGEATLTPAAFSLISDRFPRRRLATALSIYAMGSKAGTSLALVAGGFAIAFAATANLRDIPLLAGMQPWQLVFVMVGAPGLLLGFLIFSVSEPPRSRPPVDEGADAPGLVRFIKARLKLFATLFAGFCFIALPAGALPAWLPTFMSRQFGWTPVQYGPALALVSILAAITMLPKGLLVDWLYARGVRDAALRFYIWLLLIFIPVGAVTFFLTNPFLFLISVGFIQVVAIPFLLYANTTLQLITPGNLRGRMSALFLFIVPIFMQVIGVPLVGFLTDFVFHDSAKIGTSLAIVTLVGMVGAFLMLRQALKLIQPLLPDQGTLA